MTRHPATSRTVASDFEDHKPQRLTRPSTGRLFFRTCAILLVLALPARATEPGVISIDPAHPRVGNTVTLSAAVSDAVSYQWHFRGQPLAGATQSTLLLDAVERADEGLYSVVTEDSEGAQSVTAVGLTVAALFEPTQFVVDESFDVHFETDDVGRVLAAMELPDGSLLLGGDFVRFNGEPRAYLVKTSASGELDLSWEAPALSGPVHSLLRMADGSIWVGGDFGYVDGVASGGLIRLTPSLARDESIALGVGSLDPVITMAELADGSLLASGRFRWEIEGSRGTNALAKISPTGEIDARFAPLYYPIEGPVRAIAPLPDGRILVGGGVIGTNTTSASGFLVMLNADGTQDTGETGFGISGRRWPSRPVEVIRTLAEGKVMVGGRFSSMSQWALFGHMHRFLADGTLDESFDFDPTLDEKSIAILDVRERADGNYIVIGDGFAPVRLSGDGSVVEELPGAVSVGRVLRVLADGDVALWGETDETADFSFAWARVSSTVVEAGGELQLGAESHLYQMLAANGGGVWVRGDFSRVNGDVATGVVRLQANGSRDDAFAPAVFIPPTRTGGIAEDGAGRLLVHDGERLRRLFADGSVDESFAEPDYTPSAVAVDRNGRVLIANAEPGGIFGDRRGMLALRTDGQIDQDFSSPDVNWPANTILPQANGNLFLIGYLGAVNGRSKSGAALLTEDGELVPDFPYPYSTFEELVAVRPLGGFWAWWDDFRYVVHYESDGTRTPYTGQYISENVLTVVPWAEAGYVRFNAPITFPEYGNVYAHRFAPEAAQSVELLVAGMDKRRGKSTLGLWRDDGSMWLAGERLSAQGHRLRQLMRLRDARSVSITTQPVGAAVRADQTVELTVTAEGDGELIYQWYLNGVALAGKTSASLPIEAIDQADLGDYHVVVTSPFNTVTSDIATLSAADPAPVITTAPLGGQWNAGDTIRLSVDATADGPVTYQWRKSGVPIPGATASTLELPNAHAGQAGYYDVVVRYGSANRVSDTVWVRVGGTGSPTALVWDAGFAPRIEKRAGEVYALVDDPRGGVVISGRFTSVGTLARPGLARIGPDGEVDPAFDPTPGATRTVLAVQSDGGILVRRQGEQEPGKFARQHLERLLPSGEVDPDFDPPADLEYVARVVLQADGRILVSQHYTLDLIRLEVDGTRDTSFAPILSTSSAYPDAPTVVLQGDGKIVLWGGNPETVNGVAYPSICKLNTDGTRDDGFAFIPSSGVGTWDSDNIRSVVPLTGGQLLLGGRFAGESGYSNDFFNIVRINGDGSRDEALRYKLGTYVGDAFRIIESAGEFWVEKETGGSNPIYHLGPDGALGAELRLYDSSSGGGDVTFVSDHEGGLWAGGESIAQLDGPAVATAGRVIVRVDPGTEGPDLSGSWYAGDIASLSAAALTQDGKILVAGDFNLIDGVARTKLARLELDGSLDESFTAELPTSITIRKILPQPDGRVVIGGDLEVYPDFRHGDLLRLGPDGTRDETFSTLASLNYYWGVADLELHPEGGYLVAGGDSSPMVWIDGNGSRNTRLTEIVGVEEIEVAVDGTLYLRSGSSLSHVDGRGQSLGHASVSAYSFTLHPDGFVYVGTLDSIRMVRENGSSYVGYAPRVSRYTSELERDGAYLAARQRDNVTYGTYRGPSSLHPRADGGLWVNDYMGAYALDDSGRLLPERVHATQALGPYPHAGEVFLPLRDDRILFGGSRLYRNDEEVGGLALLVPHAWAGITQAPAATTTVVTGEALTLSVTAAEAGAPLRFQWFRNGWAIEGANGATFSVASSSRQDAGVYHVEVSDGVATVASEPASVEVTGLASSGFVQSYLSWADIENLQPHILALQIQGEGTRTLLLRALGPALEGLQETGVVTAPRLRLLDHTGVELEVNAGWDAGESDAAAIAQAGIAAGAVPLEPGSGDAAMVVKLSAGRYFVIVDAPRPGRSLVELYDVGEPSETAEWFYVGAMYRPQPGQGKVIGGLTVDTAEPRELMLRAIGPSLDGYYGAANPQLKLLDGNGTILTNGTAQSWDDSPAYAALAAQAGLQALVPSSVDQVLLRTFAQESATLSLSALYSSSPVWVELLQAGAMRTLTGPEMLTPPLSTRVRVGTPVSWRVIAYGEGSLTYQWFKDGEPIAEATNKGLGLGFATSDAQGDYVLRIEDDRGVLQTAPATVTVYEQPDYHDVDANQDRRIDLSELLRMIELYNTRQGTSRTGRYRWSFSGTTDGFAPDLESGAPVSLLRYHTADTDRNAHVSLAELLRVIELYNTRSGTIRTGAYRAAGGTMDGFAPSGD